jgi:hypothetical protein
VSPFVEISQLAGKLVLSNAGNRAALVLVLLLDRGVLGAAPAPPVSQQRDACLLQAVEMPQRPLTRNQHTQVKRAV